MEHGTSSAPALRAVSAEDLAAWLAVAPAMAEATRTSREWDAGVRQRMLAAMDRATNAITVGRARVVTAERDAGTWALKGDRNLADFLGRTSHQGRGTGIAQVEQARTLSALPAVADALVDGLVTAKHVQEITRATAASPKLAEQLATAEGQAQVVELARRLDGQAFGKHLKVLAAEADPVRRQREHDEQRANRYLHVTHTAGGTVIKGLVDDVAGHRFEKALEAHNPPPAESDDRSGAQRRADALGSMSEAILRDPATTPGAVAPAQVTVIIGERTWNALRSVRAGLAGTLAAGADANGVPAAGANANGAPAKGSTADLVAALRGVPAVLDEDGNPWPASEIARLVCECELTRAVVSSEGELLDLGRKERCFDRRFVKGLLAVGWTTCAWPGCTMPLRWSQLHHLKWWDRDSGRTAWTNCGPYCVTHHQWVHDHTTSASDGSATRTSTADPTGP